MTGIGRVKAVAERRYGPRCDAGHEKGWLVVDTRTGLPAASDGRDFVHLTKQDAADIADALNTYLSEGKDPPLV